MAYLLWVDTCHRASPGSVGKPRATASARTIDGTGSTTLVKDRVLGMAAREDKAGILVARCTVSAATVRGRDFDAEPYLMSEFIGVANDPVHQDATGLTMGASCSVAVSPLLGWLWQQAVAEWR